MTHPTCTAAIITAAILTLFLSAPSQAAVPDTLNYQGYITDAAGSPIDTDVVVTFSVYTVDFGGTALWTDDVLVAVDQGLFSVELGAGGTFPPGMFDTALWLGVAVDGDPEMMPRRPLTTVGFAFKADDSLSLQGQGPAAYDQSFHVADTANPHGVTTGQTGAATPVDIANLQAQLDTAVLSIASLQSDLTNANATITTLQTDLDVEVANRTAAVNAETAARIAADSTQDTAITAIQVNTVLALDGILTHPDDDTALFTGVNVQVVNGAGTTNSNTNALGNIIVGYNGADPLGAEICSLGLYDNQDDCETFGGIWAISHKSGSHNIVVGEAHNYSRFGGLVAGFNNTITGDWSSVSGGRGNTASGDYSSVSGGSGNTASEFYSSVSGGGFNTASGDISSVSGGRGNTASAFYSSVSGGSGNTASFDHSSVSGGLSNTASGNFSSVSGGGNNIASGSLSVVVGGGGLSAADGNEAFADSSAILGGRDNSTGDGVTAAVGDGATVSGGQNNTASGDYSSVSGGGQNLASGDWSSICGGGGGNPSNGNQATGIFNTICGGRENTTSNEHSTVTGGMSNSASGRWSVVSGGLGRSVSGDADWRAGLLFEDN